MPTQEEDLCTRKIKIILSHPFLLCSSPSKLYHNSSCFFPILSSAFPAIAHATRRSQERRHDLLQIFQWGSVWEGSDGDVPRNRARGAMGMGEGSGGEDKELRS